jgi:hypothetical protein
LPLLPDPEADCLGQGHGRLIHKCMILHPKCTLPYGASCCAVGQKGMPLLAH